MKSYRSSWALHHQLLPNAFEYAAKFDKPTNSGSIRLKQIIGPISRLVSVAQAISRSAQGLFRTRLQPSQMPSGGYGGGNGHGFDH